MFLGNVIHPFMFPFSHTRYPSSFSFVFITHDPESDLSMILIYCTRNVSVIGAILPVIVSRGGQGRELREDGDNSDATGLLVDRTQLDHSFPLFAAQKQCRHPSENQ